jgi:hypothetical protein
MKQPRVNLRHSTNGLLTVRHGRMRRAFSYETVYRDELPGVDPPPRPASAGPAPDRWGESLSGQYLALVKHHRVDELEIRRVVSVVTECNFTPTLRSDCHTELLAACREYARRCTRRCIMLVLLKLLPAEIVCCVMDYL